MGILERAKEAIKGAKKSYEEYQAKAPERERAKIQQLKLQNQRIRLEQEQQGLRLQKKKMLEERFGYGRASGGIKIGLDQEVEGHEVSKPKKKKGSKSIVINL